MISLIPVYIRGFVPVCSGGSTSVMYRITCCIVDYDGLFYFTVFPLLCSPIEYYYKL